MSSSQVNLIIVSFFLAVFLDWLIIRWLKKKKMREKNMAIFRNLQEQFSPFKKPLIENGLEILPLILLTFIMAAPYLNFRPNYFPNGYEFHAVTVTHYIWNLLPQCGTCVFWNGLLNGGMPAFAEVLGAPLHPLVILTTLIWGVINGSKIIIFTGLIMSGISMWWFAKELGVGRLSRIWISLFGVVGGHLIGRLESGNILFMFSVASASLLFPMVLRLYKQPTNRNIAFLAVLMALTWLSGEGYIQLGVVLGWFPAFLWLLYEDGRKRQEKWIAFGKSLLISGLLCGTLILPAGHFMINGMDKDSCSDFHDLQPMRYLPLNLVIGDAALMGQTYLGMDTFPYAHINFIDWTPVIFAILAGYFVLQQKNKRVYAAVYLSVLVTMVFTSREIYVFLAPYFPSIAKICSMGGTSSLLVPPILAMAAWGLDRLLDLEWPTIIKGDSQKGEKIKSVSLKWIILIPILVLSFKNIIPFDKNYLNVHKVEITQEELSFARLKDTQWVNAPFGGDWILVLLNENRKMIMWDRHVLWKDRQRLAGYIGLTDEPDSDVEIVSQQPNFYVTKRPNELYASVKTNQEIIKCDAVSMGGNITVTCDTPAQGVLTVLEYQFSGWYGWVDEVSAPLREGDFLSVNAPPGKHTYTFHYRPWDVYAGMLFTLIGIGIIIWLWRKKDEQNGQIMEAEL
jgi:hypothetical protein